jgi:hypothetical protein
VQGLVHLVRRQEQVRAARIGHEKTEAIGMALDPARDEVELRREAHLALAVPKHVAALHELVDARAERTLPTPPDVQPGRELAQRKRNACVLQCVEDVAACRQLGITRVAALLTCF